MLNVSAKDLATGKEQKIEIKGTSGLTEDDIKKMTEDAKTHEAEDKRRREVVEARNQADHLMHTTEKTLKEHGDKVGPQERGNIESALNNLHEVVKQDDAGAIKRAMENLMTASQEIGKKIYENVAASGTAAPTGDSARSETEKTEGGKPGEDVIEAEYEEK
jgi:molecular chaperone DnaK